MTLNAWAAFYGHCRRATNYSSTNRCWKPRHWLHSIGANTRNCIICWNIINSHHKITWNYSNCGWRHITSKRRSFVAGHWAPLESIVCAGNFHCRTPFGTVSFRVDIVGFPLLLDVDSLTEFVCLWGIRRGNQLLFQGKVTFDSAWMVYAQSVSIAARETRAGRRNWSHNHAGNWYDAFYLLDNSRSMKKEWVLLTCLVIPDIELVQESTATGSCCWTQRVSILSFSYFYGNGNQNLRAVFLIGFDFPPEYFQIWRYSNIEDSTPSHGMDVEISSWNWAEIQTSKSSES